MRLIYKTLLCSALFIGVFALTRAVDKKLKLLMEKPFTVENTYTLPNTEASEPKDEPKNKEEAKPIELTKKTIEIITLTEENSVAFRGPVTGASVSEMQTKLFEKSQKARANDSIIMVMNSPGGEVINGIRFIDSVKPLPQKVKTLTIFAASMAFQMVQNFDERLVTPSGVLMSHRASGGFEGEFSGDGKGEMITRLNWVLRIVKNLDIVAAARMSLSFKDYEELIRDEYWVTGQEAVDAKAADRVVLAKCDKTLLDGTEEVQIESFFGNATLTFSKCPLITNPTKVKISLKETATAEQKAKFQDYVDKYSFDQWGLYKDYIENGEYKKLGL